jgi:predicted aspartyl protease
MILGKIVEGRVVLPVSFCLSQTTELAIDFVVDTGFNGYLTLPSPAVAALKLPLESTIVARLTDGSESEIPIYLAEIRWNEQVQFLMCYYWCGSLVMIVIFFGLRWGLSIVD